MTRYDIAPNGPFATGREALSREPTRVCQTAPCVLIDPVLLSAKGILYRGCRDRRGDLSQQNCNGFPQQEEGHCAFHGTVQIDQKHEHRRCVIPDRNKLMGIFTVSLAVFILALSACGGDDDDGNGGDGDNGGSLSAEAYFERFSTIANAAQSDAQALSDDLSAEDGLNATADIFTETANDIDALNAPTAVNLSHGAFVDATHSLADAFGGLADAAGSDDEVSADDALNTALAIWSSRCQAVVAVGSGLGITVDVDCSVGP